MSTIFQGVRILFGCYRKKEHRIKNLSNNNLQFNTEKYASMINTSNSAIPNKFIITVVAPTPKTYEPLHEALEGSKIQSESDASLRKM